MSQQAREFVDGFIDRMCKKMDQDPQHVKDARLVRAGYAEWIDPADEEAGVRPTQKGRDRAAYLKTQKSQ